MKTVVVIQARIGGDRLPGKVTLPLGGKSVLQNVVERAQRAKLVDDVVVAKPGSEAWHIGEPWIPTTARIFGCAAGDNDLIGRYLEVAEQVQADFIIRVCADNPCVDPQAIDDLANITHHIHPICRELRTSAEHMAHDFDGYGGELYPIEMLDWMAATIKSAYYREHPHKFWYDIGNWFYCGKRYPDGLRLDVDTEADYQKLKRIYDHFGNNEFHVADAIKFLEAEKMMGG